MTSSAVTVCGALSLFVTLMGAPCRAVSVGGAKLKLLMVIVESDCDEEGGGALAVAFPLPPHPASAAAVSAIKARLKV